MSLVSQSWPKGWFFCLSTGWPHFTCTAVSGYVTPQTSGYSTLHLRSSVDMWSHHASIDSDWLVIIFLPITQFDAFTAGVIVQYQKPANMLNLFTKLWQANQQLHLTHSFLSWSNFLLRLRERTSCCSVAGKVTYPVTGKSDVFNRGSSPKDELNTGLADSVDLRENYLCDFPVNFRVFS